MGYVWLAGSKWKGDILGGNTLAVMAHLATGTIALHTQHTHTHSEWRYWNVGVLSVGFGLACFFVFRRSGLLGQAEFRCFSRLCWVC